VNSDLAPRYIGNRFHVGVLTNAPVHESMLATVSGS
jgi:hypothetical protein